MHAISWLGRMALGLCGLVLTLAAAAALAIGPLIALPGELSTDFVNSSLLKPGFILALMIVLVVGANLADLRPGASAWRYFARLVGVFLAPIWCCGLLIWINEYGVETVRPRDMVITGFKVLVSPGGTKMKTYKLEETATGWRSDLENTDEREAFARVGSCVRVDVRKGRLGLDWISQAQPIPCPSKAPGI
jgi:hypothetical protein